MTDINFRFVTSEDVPSILALFRNAFAGREISEAFYRWQFLDTPDFPFSSAVAEINESIIAHAGYTARKAKLNNRAGILFIKQSSMSAPEVQGKGIYSHLLDWAHVNLKSSKGKLVLSYPNANNHQVQILRPDYQDIYQIPVLIRTARTFDTIMPEKVIDAFPLAASYKFGAQVKTLSENCLLQCNYGLMRTPEYLIWRYAKQPDVEYRICEHIEGGRLQSLVIWKYYPSEQPDRIMVVEWLSNPDDVNGAKAFDQIEDHADMHGLAIYTWQNIYQRFKHKLLERRGYKLGEPVIYFGGFPLLSDEKIGPFHEFRKWYISMGDVDIF